LIEEISLSRTIRSTSPAVANVIEAGAPARLMAPYLEASAPAQSDQRPAHAREASPPANRVDRRAILFDCGLYMPPLVTRR
jgi:hypothetical protein